MGSNSEQSGLNSFKHFLSAWALSLGCAVGWGAFVMPATTLIPLAGTFGTAIGIALSAIIMIVIAKNFQSVINHIPEQGGLYTFTKKIFGDDHSLLCVWTIALAYISVLWANATAFTLIIRQLFGPVLQWGYCYTVAGYDVFAGEIIFTLFIILFFGVARCVSHKAVLSLNALAAIILLGGVILCFFLTFFKTGANIQSFMPFFVPKNFQTNHKSNFIQIFNVFVLAPWAFVGFAVILLQRRESMIPKDKHFPVMTIAIISSAIIYILMTLLSVLALPDGSSNWCDYILHLDEHSGIQRLPTFYAVNSALGKAGTVLLGISIICALSTSMFGLFGTLGRQIASLAQAEVMPKWFGGCNKKGLPKNAIIFIMLVSIPIPFVGRTAIGWIVDITTISASIAYAYISACCIAIAKRNRKELLHPVSTEVFGIIGLVASLIFFIFPLIPNLWNINYFASESYLILSAWSIIGFILFRIIFQHDKQNRYGKSTVMWLSMMFIILFSSTMWIRQLTYEQTEKSIESISKFHSQLHIEQNLPDYDTEPEKLFMEKQMDIVRNSQLITNIIQLVLISVTLFLMFNIFSTQKKREKKLDEEKMRAEESNKAKTVFLSNMSHDLRTPMNAIIGYTNLAQKPDTTETEIRDYITKIDSSSKHLLALINDVLEMSRIESGKMDLVEEPCDLRKLMRDIHDMFESQMSRKSIIYSVTSDNLKNPVVMCDKNRLNRVLLNLISNAYKFTPEGGSIYVSLTQLKNNKENNEDSETAFYEIRVKDNGIGMTKEFAKKIFDAFERERTSTISGIQGTGLGMTITKNILDLMGGTISLVTEKGEGSEFTIQIPFRILPTDEEGRPENAGDGGSAEEKSDGSQVLLKDFSKMRLLLVDDMDVNRELAAMILQSMGFKLEMATNGQEAVEKVKTADEGWFNAVLMDIQMPVMDGYEATKQIRALPDKNKASIPIIAMTANAFAEDIKKASEAGMNAHVAKPIDVENLTATLKAIL